MGRNGGKSVVICRFSGVNIKPMNDSNLPEKFRMGERVGNAKWIDDLLKDLGLGVFSFGEIQGLHTETFPSAVCWKRGSDSSRC